MIQATADSLFSIFLVLQLTYSLALRGLSSHLVQPSRNVVAASPSFSLIEMFVVLYFVGAIQTTNESSYLFSGHLNCLITKLQRLIERPSQFFTIILSKLISEWFFSSLGRGLCASRFLGTYALISLWTSTYPLSNKTIRDDKNGLLHVKSKLLFSSFPFLRNLAGCFLSVQKIKMSAGNLGWCVHAYTAKSERKTEISVS